MSNFCILSSNFFFVYHRIKAFSHLFSGSFIVSVCILVYDPLWIFLESEVHFEVTHLCLKSCRVCQSVPRELAPTWHHLALVGISASCSYAGHRFLEMHSCPGPVVSLVSWGCLLISGEFLPLDSFAPALSTCLSADHAGACPVFLLLLAILHQHHYPLPLLQLHWTSSKRLHTALPPEAFWALDESGTSHLHWYDHHHSTEAGRGCISCISLCPLICPVMVSVSLSPGMARFLANQYFRECPWGCFWMRLVFYLVHWVT